MYIISYNLTFSVATRKHFRREWTLSDMPSQGVSEARPHPSQEQAERDSAEPELTRAEIELTNFMYIDYIILQKKLRKYRIRDMCT
jgi:hypothetical protein